MDRITTSCEGSGLTFHPALQRSHTDTASFTEKDFWSYYGRYPDAPSISDICLLGSNRRLTKCLMLDKVGGGNQLQVGGSVFESEVCASKGFFFRFHDFTRSASSRWRSGRLLGRSVTSSDLS